MSVVRPPTYEPAPRRRKTSRELLEEILEEIGPVAPQAPAPEETARAVNQPPAIGIMGQERSRRRAAAGLPINIGVAEPEDLETSPEKYGYVGGKNPVQIAEEAYRATGGPEHLAEREAQYARDLAKARHGTESQAALADVRRLDQAVVDKVEDELRAGTSPYLKEQLFPPSPMTSAITWGHEKLGNLKPLPEEYVRAKRRLENDLYGRGDIIPEIGHGVVGAAKGVFGTIFSPVTEIAANLRERSPQDPLAKGLETAAAFATPGLAKFTAGTAAAQWAARSIVENTGLSDRAKEDALEAIGFAGGLASAHAKFGVSGAKAAYGKAVEGTKTIGAEIRGATGGGGGTTYGPEGLRFQTPGGLETEALSREAARRVGGAGPIEGVRAREAGVIGALARGHTAEKALGVVRERRAGLEAENAARRAAEQKAILAERAARDTEAALEAQAAVPRAQEAAERRAAAERAGSAAKATEGERAIEEFRPPQLTEEEALDNATRGLETRLLVEKVMAEQAKATKASPVDVLGRPAAAGEKTIPALKPADIPWAMPYVDPYAATAPKAPAPAAEPAPALSAEPRRPVGGLPTEPQAELRPTDIDITPAVMVGGKIIAGKKGQTHASIEATLPKDAPPGSIQSGWVDSDGKFLTDDQAVEVVAKAQGRPVDKAMGHSAYVSFSEDAKAAGIDLSRVEPRDIWDTGSAIEYERGMAPKLGAGRLQELIAQQDRALQATADPLAKAKATALRGVYTEALQAKAPAAGLPAPITEAPAAKKVGPTPAEQRAYNKALRERLEREHAAEPTAPTTTDAFAAAVKGIVGKVSSEGWFGDNKVFISDLWNAAKNDPRFASMSEADFKAKLIEANRERTLALNQADLVGTMDQARVRGSKVNDGMSDFHFLRVGEAAKPSVPAQAPAAPPFGGAKAEAAKPPFARSDLKPIFDEHGINTYMYSVQNIPSDKIVTSHTKNGTPDPRYRSDLQSRDFDIRRAREYAQNLDENKLLPEGSTFASGSPVVWLDPDTGLYHVVAGNHRQVARAIAGKEGPVRVLEGTLDEARQAAAASQRAEAAPESVVERGRATVRASGLTPADAPRNLTAEPITPDNVEAFVNKNPAFAKKVLGPKGIQEKASAVDTLNAALVGLLPEGAQRAMQDLGAKVEQAITSAAPALLELHESAKSGRILPEFDILSRLDRASQALESVGGPGGSAKRLLKRLNDAAEQPSLPGIPEDPVRSLDQADAGLLLGLASMEGRANPAEAISSTLASVRARAMSADFNPKQASMFGEPASISPIELVREMWGDRVAENAKKFKPSLTPKTKGERGMILNPVELAKQAGRAIADLFDSAREKLGFEDNPKLDRVATGHPLFTAADEIKALRLAKANVGEQTESWVKNFVIKGSGIKDRLAYDRVSEYLIFLRDRDLLLSGKKSADLTLERVEQELRAVEETIDPAVLAKVRAHHKELTDITAKKLKDMGLKNEWTDSTNPDGSPKFYSPRVILARKAGKGTGGGGSTIAERAPGSLRHTEGTELDRESDGFKALGYHIQDVLSSWYDYQFAKNMKARSLNAQIREGDIPDDVALYSFGKKGAGTVVNDVDVTKLLSKGEFIDKRGVRRRRTTYREAFEEGPPDVKESFKKVEPGDPFLRLDQFGEPTGEELYAFPRETVEGLAEASQRMSPPPRSGLGRLINSASGVIRRLRIAGPSYLGRQLLEDPAWASYNLPPQYVTHFLAELKRQSRIVREEMAKERRGERSKIMEEARLGTAERPPMVNASFENLMYDVVERGGAKLEPWFKKSLTNKLVYVLDGFDLPAKIVSEWRELSNKLAIAETLETKMGLDPMLAGKRAHEYLGNYWSRSPVMEEYGNLSIFLKWASEATIKMTRNFAKDPRTGNSSVRGFLEGPLSKSLVFGTIVATWNDYIISNMKPEGRKDEPLELPLSAGGDGYFGQAFIVPTWKSGRPVPMRASDGNLIAISISGARGILDGLVDTSDAVVRGRLAKATGIVGKGLIGHLAPQLQIPLEAYTGNRMSGQPITSYRHQNLSAEQQSALNLKDHPYSPIALAFKAAGIPYTDKAAYFASQALGGIPRNIESLFASDQNLIDRARGSVGIPLMSFDPRSGNQQAAYREADDLFAIISRETGKRVAGRPYSQEAIQAAYTRARQLDPKLPGVLKRRLKSGFTTFAKEAPLTPTQRKEQQLQRKYGPKTPAAPFESSGPANPPF